MKKRLLMMILSSCMVLGSVMPVYAAPEDATVEEADDSEDTTEETESEDEEESKEETISEEEFVGIELEEAITETTKSSENNAQINFSCRIPEYFTLGAYIELQNEDTGKIYRIFATSNNEYIGRMFVPDGKYHVMICGIWEDNTSKYPMTQPNDFEIEENGVITVESTLVNYDDIEAEAKRRMEEDRTEETATSDESLSFFDFESEDEKDPLPWRVITHTGDGHGRLSIAGTSNGIYKIVIDITSTGGIKEGEFKYSTDGGQTWSDTQVILSRCKLYDTASDSKYDSDKETGLELSFNSKDTYLIYDRYTIDTQKEYKFNSDTLGAGIIRLYSDGDIIGKYKDFAIKISDTGSCGTGTFKYTLNGATYSDKITIPATGIYEIPDVGLKIQFYDKEGEFLVNDEFTAELEGIKSQKDYTVSFIIIGVIIVGALFGVMTYIILQKDSPKEYKLNVYHRVELPNKRGKNKK